MCSWVKCLTSIHGPEILKFVNYLGSASHVERFFYSDQQTVPCINPVLTKWTNLGIGVLNFQPLS